MNWTVCMNLLVGVDATDNEKVPVAKIQEYLPFVANNGMKIGWAADASKLFTDGAFYSIYPTTLI